MSERSPRAFGILVAFAVGLALAAGVVRAEDQESGSQLHRRLYVAVPGIRNYLEYGGHGLLVFDIDDGHRFLRRIKTAGLAANGKPLNVKGICASAETGRLYISTIRQIMCLDLVSEELLWEKTYESGCDRLAISPDGKILYVAFLRRADMECRRCPRWLLDRDHRARLWRP